MQINKAKINTIIIKYDLLSGQAALNKVNEIENTLAGRTKVSIIVPYLSREMDNAISIYHKKNTEVQINIINYKEDMLYNKEDYIQYVNLQIMAGSEWDILPILNIPYNEFIKKGILADINEIDAKSTLEVNSNFFQNIINACRIDGKLYYLPTDIYFYVVAGNDKYFIENGYTVRISELNWSDFLSLTLSLNAESRIINDPTGALYYAYAKDFIDFNRKTINTDVISEYLSLHKIFKQMQYNIPKNETTRTGGSSVVVVKDSPEEIFMFKSVLTKNDVIYLANKCRTTHSLYSIPVYMGISNNNLSSYNRVFTVNNGYAINNKSQVKAEAFDFINFLADASSSVSSSKKAFKNNMLDINANNNFISSFERCIGELDTVMPYIDNGITNTIINQSNKYSNEQILLEDAIQLIEEKVWLFLNE